ncbi:hypothetical protein AB4Y87_25640 [Paenarthrobacter sp. RAF54_2]|uniref:hypothetical protein n=1 Tax=Paenarthrobacter sp. RAF54_2 TaxID=3233061 RepID=UPI003F9C8C1A
MTGVLGQILMLQQFVPVVEHELMPVVKANPGRCRVFVNAKILNRNWCMFSADALI